MSTLGVFPFGTDQHQLHFCALTPGHATALLNFLPPPFSPPFFTIFLSTEQVDEGPVMDKHEVIKEAIRQGSKCTDSELSVLRSWPLVAVCAELQTYLCDEATLAAAMTVLSLAATQRAAIEESEVQLLCTFFCEKLLKPGHAKAAISALGTFIADVRERRQCSRETFQLLVNGFLSNVSFEALPVSVRRHAYGITCFMFSEENVGIADARTLSMLFEAVDGESDPELVLSVLGMCQTVCNHGDKAALRVVAADMFDCVASYFPVVFTQPPGCPVTKQDLKRSLRDAMSLEAFGDYCIPFLLGKLASPSVNVKEDVLDTLSFCVEKHSDSGVVEHLLPVVVQVRNEVLKLTSHTNWNANTSLRRCVANCCGLLHRISEKCADSTKDEALERFHPVTEGLLASLDASRDVCAAYATMAHAIVSGSWTSCESVGCYLFSMLTLNLSPVSNAAALMLLSAVANGMTDCVITRKPTEDQRNALQQRVGKTATAVVSALQCLPLALAEASTTDEYTVLCGIEFVSAVVRFALELNDWMPADVIADSLDAIVTAAVENADTVREKATAALLVVAGVKWSVAASALTKLCSSPCVPAEGALQLLTRLACCSADALVWVTRVVLHPSETSWLTTTVTAKRRVDVVRFALEHAPFSLEDSTVDTLLLTLEACGEASSFDAMCTLYLHATDGYVSAASDSIGVMHPLRTAALLASRGDLRVPAAQVPVLLPRLKSMAPGASVGRHSTATLNGVTGLVRNTAYGPQEDTGRGDSELAVAAAWGMLLRDGEAGSLSETQQMVDDILLAGQNDENLPVTLSFSPFAAAHTVHRGSLLLCFLHSSNAPTDCGVWWRTLHLVVSGESSDYISLHEPELLSALCESKGSKEVNGLVRVVVEALQSKSPNLATQLLLKRSDYTAAIADAIHGTELPVRLSSLRSLSNLGTTVEKLYPSAKNATDRQPVLEAKRMVLAATQSAVSDHKRKVRQEAARCRHLWYKIS